MQNDIPYPGASRKSLAADLRELIETHEHETITFNALLDLFGERGFGLIFLILAFPSLLPLPLPGLGAPLTLVMILVALQLIFGRKRPILPQWAGRKTLSFDKLKPYLEKSIRMLDRFERLIKPRHESILNRVVITLIGLIVVLMGVLITLPLPLANSFPAFVVVINSIAMLERDGLLSMFGLFLGAVAVVIYSSAFYFILILGVDLVGEVRSWLPF